MTRRSLFTALVLVAVAPASLPRPARAAETRAFALTTDFSTGSLSTVNLSTRAVAQDVEPAGSDATFRWYQGNLYIVNRFGGDNVQVVDGTTLDTAHQWSTGNGSNPQDICFVSPTKAYVTRYESGDLLILNPQTGASPGVIHLGQFADADGIPEMAHLVRVERYVFVALQRLNRNAGFTPTDSSLVAVIDSQTDSVVDTDPGTPGVQAITLAGKDPVTQFEFDHTSSRLLIGCVGAFGALDGGIEWIDPVNFRSLGYAITETALGGDIGDITWWRPDHAYAIVSDASFNTLLVSWNPATGVKIATVYAPGGYSLTDSGVNDRDELYVCNNDLFNAGLHVFAAGTDAHLAGPLDCGLPPHDVTFDATSEEVLAVAPGGVAAALRLEAASPNPARARCTLRCASARGGAARVEVFDVLGRSVRVLLQGVLDPGAHELAWDLRDQAGARVAPGVYAVRVRIGGEEATRRVVVAR
jgi:hypothetical protein